MQGKNNRDDNLMFILGEFWIPVKTTKGHNKTKQNKTKQTTTTTKTQHPTAYSCNKMRRVRKTYKLQIKYKLGEEHMKSEQHGLPNGVGWQVLWERTGSEIL